jgi:hypothetical protein
MKKKHFFTLVFLFIISLFFAVNPLHAQCDCNQPDPYGYCYSAGSTIGTIGSSCGLQSVSIYGNTNVSNCGTASCSVSSLYQDYNLYFPYSNTVTGFYYKIIGGVVSRETIVRGNGYSQVVRQNCTSEAQYGSVNYINSLTLRINWTTSSPNNCILIWGYTGVGAYPTTLSNFNSLSVSVSSATSPPAAPTGISISSPTSYGICGWKVASSYVSNATSYTWSGAGSGTYQYITGPGIAENQTAYICVKANNACGSSANYCAYVTIPNNSSCGYVRNPGIPQGTEIDVTSQQNGTAEFIVSPNPASNLIIVTGITSETIAVNILSLEGKIVRSVTPNGQNRVDVDVADLAKGMYLVILRQKDGKPLTKKVMLQ